MLVGPIHANEVKVGDIVLYQMPNKQKVLHRVIAIDTSAQGAREFTFKGDNNNTPDLLPVHDDQLIGRYMGHVPKIGWVAIKFNQLIGGLRELSRLDELIAGLARIDDDLDELRVTLRESSPVATLPPVDRRSAAIAVRATVANPATQQSAVAPVAVTEPQAVPERGRRAMKSAENVPASFARTVSAPNSPPRLSRWAWRSPAWPSCGSLRPPPAGHRRSRSIRRWARASSPVSNSSSRSMAARRSAAATRSTATHSQAGAPTPSPARRSSGSRSPSAADFDPNNDLVSETHPATRWTFTPQATELRWTSVSAGSGPLNEEFTFELAGNADLVDTRRAGAAQHAQRTTDRTCGPRRCPVSRYGGCARGQQQIHREHVAEHHRQRRRHGRLHGAGGDRHADEYSDAHSDAKERQVR